MGGEGRRGERGRRSLLKKLRKTFMKKGDGISFVQVRVRTNFAPSKASEDRSGAAHRVWFAKLRDPPSIFCRCGRSGGEAGELGLFFADVL